APPPAGPPPHPGALGRDRRWRLPARERGAAGLGDLLRGAERPGAPPRAAGGVAAPGRGARRRTPARDLPRRSRAHRIGTPRHAAAGDPRGLRHPQAGGLRPARGAHVTATEAGGQRDRTAEALGLPDGLREHLVASALAGDVATSPRQTLRNCGKLVSGHDEYTFGLDDWRSLTLREAVDAVRA